MSPLDAFHEPTRAWFARALGAPTRAQREGWPAILRGESTLLCSPTGSGKTLAAFLASIDRLAFSEPGAPGVRVLYVSPLRALAVDVDKNLRRPLEGIAAEAQGAARVPTVGVRTGDTPASERAAMLRRPPEILITTPESLYLLLSSRGREGLRTVDTVIVDEIHQLVPNKRGAHLFVSLERLERLRPAGRALQRIGLSATQRPLEVTARALGGMDRAVTVIDAGEPRRLSLAVEAFDFARRVDDEPEAAARAGKRSVWPEIHARLLELVRAHRSTIVFCNSRRLAERLAAALCDLAGAEVARAHHGSLAREQRSAIEEKLKRGEIPCIVATSSLELGIDMGAVDLVVQIEAPPSVASGIQRIGRASHHVGGVPAGVILPKHRGDLFACAAAAEGVLAGDVEPVRWPKNPLDVLAQHIVSIGLEGPARVSDVLALVRRAAPFGELPESAFAGVLEMLSGRYPSHAFSGLRARVTWDRKAGVLVAREGARAVAVANAGTIPDRGLYGVFFERGGKSVRVGELDEEMVFESREGDVVALGATPWRIERITPDRVTVVPAPGEPARTPFWKGDGPGRARAFGLRVGELAREAASEPERAAARLGAAGLTDAAVAELLAHAREQKAASEVPSDRAVVVERFRDDVGDLRVCVLTPLGARVHAPWALSVATKLREAGRGAPDVFFTDDGIVFRVAAGDAPPPPELFVPAEAEIRPLLARALPGSPLFAARFRECASRALLLPRRRPGKRTPLWAQRKRSTDLLAVASQYPEFPILLETMRECLADAFDVDGLEAVLRDVERGEVRVHHRDVDKPSPFARGVLFSFVGAFLYDDDMPAPERRAQALALDFAQLEELLGEADLRALLDPDVVCAHERFLQRTDARASSVDGLHDLLLSVGDLGQGEIAARFEGDAGAAVATLLAAGRAFETTIAGDARLVAAEDASRVRDALGARVPAGLPADLLEAVPEPLADLVLRYARTHGPFSADDAAKRFGVPVEEALRALARRGALREGKFRAAGAGAEWCAVEVLSALRGRTLAALRRATEPVSAEALSRFALRWHGVGGRSTLEEAIARLEGLPVSLGALERSLLPARVADFRAHGLDALVATGAVAWVALDVGGGREPRVALALAEHEAVLLPSPGRAPGALAARVREHLERRGASFTGDILRAVGGFPGDAARALWDMATAFEVSNDTLDAVRALSGADGTRRPPREGRWFLRASRLEREATPTERAAALARALLARHGVLSREAALAEGVEGGFARLYPVLRAMEDAGRAQRGLFAHGSSGAQFALPEAVAALRAARDEPSASAVLAATDPANLWGSVLPWPAPRGSGRPARASGARVVLANGALLAWIAPGGEAMLTWTDGAEARGALAAALRGVGSSGEGPLRIATVNGATAGECDLAPHLRAAGFVPLGPTLSGPRA